MKKKIVGIIGCGVIGSKLAGYITENLEQFISRVVICDMDASKAGALKEDLVNAEIGENISDAINVSDLIIEAASPGIVPDLVREAIDAGKDVMVMSIGGFLGNEQLIDDAREKGIRLILPSGAISGIDAIKASKEAGIKEVMITTRKAPRSIKGAPYLVEKGIDVDVIKSEEVIFEGSALEAVKGFPKNVNVAALLSITGIGPERTKVRIVVSPEYTRNSHEIKVESEAGSITTLTENVPSPDNPKTSYLAVLAAIASLKGYFDTVRIGT